MNIDLRTLIPTPPTKPKLMTYVMGWWGDSGHTGATYDSADPVVVGHQLDLMQAVGIDGAIPVWYGADRTRKDQCSRLFANQTAQRNMLFALMIDRGTIDNRPDKTIDPTTWLTTQIGLTAELLTTPSYIPEKYVLSFDLRAAGANLDAVPLPSGYKWLEQNKPGGFTWIQAPGTRASQLAYEATQRQTNNSAVGCVSMQFDDQSPVAANCTQSVWGGNRRTVDGERGGLFLDLFNLPINSALKYIGLCTWNDYEERTALEGLLAAFTGIRIGK